MNVEFNFKIYDLISNKDDVLIFRLPREKINYDNIGDYIPLSSYYYETIILCNEKINLDEKLIDIILDFKNVIYKLWCYFSDSENYNPDHFEKISDDILNFSKEIKNAVKRKDDKIKRKFDDFFGSINDEKYEMWCEENEGFFECISSINCVAIAYPIDTSLRDSSNSYFSLNGASTDYTSRSVIKTNGKNNWRYDLYRYYKLISKLIESLFGFKFIASHLTKTTKRYTEFDTLILKGYRKWDGRVLKYPIKLNSDFNSNFLPNSTNKAYIENFERHYSCCEKKIISKMNFINRDYHNLRNGNKVINKLTSYVFRVIKQPCEMCRPALIGCYNIFFGDFSYPHEVIYSNINPNEPLILK